LLQYCSKKSVNYLSISRIYLIFILIFPVFAQNKPLTETESQLFGQYGGVVGTAPTNQTISNAGVAIEFWPNANNFFGFFSQTLANNIYYEIRLYGRNNYQSANPDIPNLPTPTGSVPMGYGISTFLGYNFHVNPVTDITPYLRVNLYKDMGPVYNNNQGDFIDSNTYALLVGGKLAFRVNTIFAPYINIWGGYVNNGLTGAFPNSATSSNQSVTGTLNQAAITYEIGASAKLSEHVFIIPYFGYNTIFNYPDSTAQTAIDQGGLNQSNLTGTAAYYGLKLNVAW
jgi:hypothetical protein